MMEVALEGDHALPTKSTSITGEGSIRTVLLTGPNNDSDGVSMPVKKTAANNA